MDDKERVFPSSMCAPDAISEIKMMKESGAVLWTQHSLSFLLPGLVVDC